MAMGRFREEKGRNQSVNRGGTMERSTRQRENVENQLGKKNEQERSLGGDETEGANTAPTTHGADHPPETHILHTW